MTDENAQTLKVYEEHFQDYISGTHSQTTGDYKVWLRKALKTIKKKAKILEIGSAAGRDADYIESLGFVVQRSDAVRGFVEHLESNGQKSIVLNVLTDEIPKGYDLILAAGVFLHFTPEQLKQVLAKIYRALAKSGLLVFSVKQGIGSEWSSHKVGEPRFFQYWQEPELRQILAATGFIHISIKLDSDEKWLLVTVQKPN